MSFTSAEVTSIANASLDFYLNKGKAFGQSIQKKPLLDRLTRTKKTFSGGKGDISVGVKGTYGAGGTNDGVTGYTHDDTVSFYTPENIQRAAYTWREMHIGMALTHTELKIDGISVTDENGSENSKHSKRDMHALVGLLENKMEDLGEQYASTMNTLLLGDGTGDAKALAGIQSIVTANPATGTVGGINRATAANSWWKNLAALETEMRANGNYSDKGFADGGNDFAVTGLNFMGQKFIYDPTLDDLSLPKRCYWIDTKAIFLMNMEGEWNRTHTPSRASNQFVMHRSITCTGQMVARQCNSSLVVDIT